MTRYVVGLDVGQAQDYTAIAVIQRIPRATGKQRRTWTGSAVAVEELTADDAHLRYLERPELHTSYTDVVARVVALMGTRALKGNADIVVDYTGVGRPVVDLLRASGVNPIPVSITGGAEERYDREHGVWNVPKRVLVSNAQILIQQERFKFAPELALAQTFIKELLAFKVKINANAHASYEAWREGAHDDLVLATALALWWASKAPTGARTLEKPRDPMSAEYEAWSEQELDERLKAEQEERERWGLT